MHMVIYAIVPAASKEEAISKAQSIFEDITGEGKSFDYYQTFETEGSAVSGKGRYGNVPSALRVKTKAGAKMVAEGFGFTKGYFMENMARIRTAMSKFTDAEIFEEKSARGIPKEEATDLFLVRHTLYNAGKYDGSSVWQYDRFGSGIRSQKDLDSALDTSEIPPNEELYIVPADVHF